jgi:hypothetical protein
MQCGVAVGVGFPPPGFGVAVGGMIWVGAGVAVVPGSGVTEGVEVAESVEVAVGAVVAVGARVAVGGAMVAVGGAGWSEASPGKVSAIISCRLVKPSPSESVDSMAPKAATFRPLALYAAP